MSHIKLKDRIDSYQDACDYKLLNRVPVIIVINGRSFSKTTSLIDKPYCSKFAECMMATTLKLCSELEGNFFAYQHSDEIVLVSRNDQNVETLPWLDNRIQKLCSISASLATLFFNGHSKSRELNLIGESIFTSQIFVVPNVAEAINTFIYKQQNNFYTSIQFACFYELLRKYDKNTIREMLYGLTVDEKIDLLNQECDIDFNNYSSVFRRGAACYKIPKVVDGVMKNKWVVNTELPIFTKDQSFLSNIFRCGQDIFRAD
jgi:tRNA(His) guanylyltransferase